LLSTGTKGQQVLQDALLDLLGELDFVAVDIALQFANERLPSAPAHWAHEFFEIAVRKLDPHVYFWQ
jgi:hypothetical protein